MARYEGRQYLTVSFCLVAGIAAAQGCNSSPPPSAESTARTQQAVSLGGTTLNVDGTEPAPFSTYVQGYILPDTTTGAPLDHSQGLNDLASMRDFLESPYVPQGNMDPPPSGSSGGSSGGSSSGSSGPSSGPCGWMHVGPTNVPGRVLGFATDPNDSTHLFAATVGGVWRSKTAGRRWERVSDDFLGSKAQSVAINPTNGQEVIAGLGDGQNAHPAITGRPAIQPLLGTGIWISTSGGDRGTWTQVTPTALASSVVSKLLYSPDGSTVYAATSAGVFKGTGSGASKTFTQLGTLTFPTDSLVADFTPTPAILYAGVSNSGANSGVWKYDGTSWTQKSSGLPSDAFWRVTVAIAKSQLKTLYVKLASSTGALTGIYKTITGAEPADGGPAWTALSPGLPDDASATVGGSTFSYSHYVSMLEVDPTNDKILFSGGVLLYQSTDGGNNWGIIGGQEGFGETGNNCLAGGNDFSNFPLAIHSDQHALAFDVNNPGIVYVGNDGGVYKSGDTKTATWHWNKSAHGMATTEFYDIATQQATASLVAGGSQDNGTEITFGNHAWYVPGTCDGSTVAVDALNGETLYSNCNGTPMAIVQPVPYAAAGLQFVVAPGSSLAGQPGVSLTNWSIPSGDSLSIPIATDPTNTGIALAAGTDSSGNGIVLKTTDRLTWTSSLGSLAAGSRTSIGAFDPTHRIVISSASPKTYYAWVNNPTAGTAAIYASANAGSSWAAGTGLTATTSVNGIASDPNNSKNAVAATSGAVGGNIFLSTNSGGSWTQATTIAGGAPLPTGSVRNVVYDPTTANTIYVAHQVGVFQGTISGTSVSWVPFDQGLPNGCDVKDVAVNPSSKTLTIGTFGFGAYTRSLTASSSCPTTQLIVRDTVFDQGQSPTLSGIPDPEHPRSDTGPFFKPDDTSGGKAYWWESTDIRIDIPSIEPAANQLTTVDNVEFETCPVEDGNCGQGMMIDTNPVRGASANAYVQVTNRGLQPSSNVRVITLFTPATTQVPNLPSDFWTTTFPAGQTTCGALSSTTPWQLVGCTSIPVVNPDYPEVAQFPWTVPTSAPDHSCMLTVVESADDPIPSTIRGQLATGTIVQNDRHIAQRNLHILSPPGPNNSTGSSNSCGGPPPNNAPPYTGVTSLLVPNMTTTATTRTVLISRSGMGNGRVSFLLPPGVASQVTGLPAACGGSGTPPAGASQLSISLPKSVTEQLVGVEASGTMLVGDHVIITGKAGGFGGVGNAGSLATTIGDRAQVGSVYSVAPVTLDEHATVNGTVETSRSSITQEQGATVSGGVQTSAALTPSDHLEWLFTFPSGLGPPVNVPLLHTTHLAPGTYGRVTVPLSGTLALTSGTYFIDTLNINAGANVTVNTAGGPTIVYVRTNWSDLGTVTESPGGGANLLVVYLSPLPLGIAGPFQGSFVAPNALLTIGPTGLGGPAVGSFFAQNVNVFTGQSVVTLPFSGWSGLGACNALTSAELTAAQAAGLDPTAVYPVSNVETQVVLPVAPGGNLTLGVRYESGSGLEDSAGRFRVLSLDGTTVLGGSTFVVRRR